MWNEGSPMMGRVCVRRGERGLCEENEQEARARSFVCYPTNFNDRFVLIYVDTMYS